MDFEGEYFRYWHLYLHCKVVIVNTSSDSGHQNFVQTAGSSHYQKLRKFSVRSIDQPQLVIEDFDDICKLHDIVFIVFAIQIVV